MAMVIMVRNVPQTLSCHNTNCLSRVPILPVSMVLKSSDKTIVPVTVVASASTSASSPSVSPSPQFVISTTRSASARQPSSSAASAILMAAPRRFLLRFPARTRSHPSFSRAVAALVPPELVRIPSVSLANAPVYCVSKRLPSVSDCGSIRARVVVNAHSLVSLPILVSVLT